MSDPNVMAQAGMRVGIPNAGQLNALATLNIRGERSVTCKGALRRPPVNRAAAAGRASRVRGVSQAARCARTCRRTRRAVWTQSRPGRAPDVLRRCGVQGSVRHEGHADDSQQRRGVRHGRPAVRFDGRGAAACQGRDHLREVERARVQRRDRAIQVERRRAARTRSRAAKPSARGRARHAIRTTPSACRADRAADRESRYRRTW